MRSICVWAYHTDVIPVCRSAGLDTSTPLHYPQGNTHGQAGWHVAVSFNNLHHLATQLIDGLPMPSEFCGRWFGMDCDPIAHGEIVRLAIMAHGDQGGQIAVDGRAHEPYLKPETIGTFHDDLHHIGLYTPQQGASILLMRCLAGQGDAGTRLLTGLSQVWPGRKVTGFSTAGYRHPGSMARSGTMGTCVEPGMRDTDATAYLYANPPRWDQEWSDLVRLPWASESSPHAKTALNGALIRCPDGELCAPVPAGPRPTPPRREGVRTGRTR